MRAKPNRLTTDEAAQVRAIAAEALDLGTDPVQYAARLAHNLAVLDMLEAIRLEALARNATQEKKQRMPAPNRAWQLVMTGLRSHPLRVGCATIAVVAAIGLLWRFTALREPLLPGDVASKSKFNDPERNVALNGEFSPPERGAVNDHPTAGRYHRGSDGLRTPIWVTPTPISDAQALVVALNLTGCGANVEKTAKAVWINVDTNAKNCQGSESILAAKGLAVELDGTLRVLVIAK